MSIISTLTEREELLGMVSDMYKDAYGTRPRGIYTLYTNEQLKATLDSLEAVIVANMKEEKIAELSSIEAFNELLNKTIDMGAGDRETALRWLYDGSDIGEPMSSQDLEHFVYQQGMLCTKEGDALKEELIKIFYTNNQN